MVERVRRERKGEEDGGSGDKNASFPTLPGGFGGGNRKQPSFLESFDPASQTEILLRQRSPERSVNSCSFAFWLTYGPYPSGSSSPNRY